MVNSLFKICRTLEVAESMKKEKRYRFYIEENFNEEEKRLWRYIEGEIESV